MDTLLHPRRYPNEVREAIAKMPPLATDIANRWMLGWPKTVAALLTEGGYLEALTDQEQREREVYSHPGNGHLARHEIADLYGLSPGPPTSG